MNKQATRTIKLVNVVVESTTTLRSECRFEGQLVFAQTEESFVVSLPLAMKKNVCCDKVD